MDKKTALETIIAIIVPELSKREHQVGYSYYEDGDEYKTNFFCYEENGWFVDLSYDLCGKWVVEKQTYWTPGDEYISKVWGNISGLDISYENEETGESYEYSEDELEEFKEKLLEEIIDSIPLY